MTSLLLRIRKRYFDDIVAGLKKTEYRKKSPFWISQIEGKNPDIAVFVCGKRVHRRHIEMILEVKTPDWFSEQGKKDVDTPTCYAVHLGKEVSQ